MIKQVLHNHSFHIRNNNNNNNKLHLYSAFAKASKRFTLGKNIHTKSYIFTFKVHTSDNIMHTSHQPYIIAIMKYRITTSIF